MKTNFDFLVDTIYSAAILSVIHELSNRYRVAYGGDIDDRKHALVYAEGLFKSMNRKDYTDTLNLVLKSYLWFNDVRSKRVWCKIESGYVAFINELSVKYSALIGNIEAGDVRLDNSDRLKLNELIRESENIEHRQFNEGTSFCTELIRRRQDISDFYSALMNLKI
jgi:hypothetical protein